MTREEAITYLQVIWNRYKAEYEIERETLDAYHMAIEALSAEPSKVDFRTEESANIDTKVNDLISREDAKKAFCRINDLRTLSLGKVGEVLDALPSAELVLQTPQTYGKSINPSNAEVVADYISRADAIEAVMKHKMPFTIQQEVAREIDTLPSADAVQGEWIMHELWGNPWFTCSECNYHGRNDFNYCPNCGAKMEKNNKHNG